ncbi:hypothetical protein TNIN_331361 [Trichonephila inaurata madagascariensis]|uniref:Uncharacterized protein n=1 Tax=Trichonephila inaurata madagascariensis TaxID=2747483 RepID=A0A8X6YN81_9ARAC|nr:hypothetical protein TNIN_331361 [Trichonephila inaurata madagascariensis]
MPTTFLLLKTDHLGFPSPPQVNTRQGSISYTSYPKSLNLEINLPPTSSAKTARPFNSLSWEAEGTHLNSAGFAEI